MVTADKRRPSSIFIPYLLGHTDRIINYHQHSHINQVTPAGIKKAATPREQLLESIIRCMKSKD
jgi:hypothetical protein